MKLIMNLLSLGLVFTLLGCGTSVSSKKTPDSASWIRITSHAALSSKNEPDISMDEFEQIKDGMTYEQVTEIVGSPGERVLETGSPGDRSYTLAYQFEGEKELFDIFRRAYAELTFQSGKLITKSQMGIKKSSYEKLGKFK